MKHFKFLSFAVICASIFTACGSNDTPDGSYQAFSTSGVMLAVTETDHFTTQLMECNSAEMLVNIGVGAEYTINGFRTNPSDMAKVLTVPGLTYKIDGKNVFTVGKDIVPKINGTSNPDYAISIFSTNLYAGKNTALFFSTAIEMGNYIITTPYNTYLLSGQTKVSKATTETDVPYVNENARYIIRIDRSTKTANLEINGAKFAAMMPPQNMVFPNLDIIFAREGFELQAESLIPTIGGTPYPDYEVTDVSLLFKNEADVPSTCRFTVENSKKGWKYNVLATLNY